MRARYLIRTTIFVGAVFIGATQLGAHCLSGANDVSKWRSAKNVHSQISKVPPKSEYEKGDVWADRVVKALAENNIFLQQSYWIEIFPQQGGVKYDAETEHLYVGRSAFLSTVYQCKDVLPSQLMMDLYGSSCIDKSRAITVQENHTDGPSYVGQNAYGVTREVSRSNTEFVTLFEGPIGYDDPVWGGLVDSGKEHLLSLQVSPADAPLAKTKVRFAAQIKFKYPLASSNVKGFRASVDFPTRLEYTYTTLVGDIQCIAMVLPDQNLFFQRALP